MRNVFSIERKRQEKAEAEQQKLEWKSLLYQAIVHRDLDKTLELMAQPVNKSTMLSDEELDHVLQFANENFKSE
jgi:hypothetical protein